MFPDSGTIWRCSDKNGVGFKPFSTLSQRCTISVENQTALLPYGYSFYMHKSYIFRFAKCFLKTKCDDALPLSMFMP